MTLREFETAITSRQEVRLESVKMYFGQVESAVARLKSTGLWIYYDGQGYAYSDVRRSPSSIMPIHSLRPYRPQP